MANKRKEKATGMTDRDILECTKRDRVRFVQLQFTDLNGILKGVTIPVSKLGDALKDGLWFDGSSIEGFMAISESDMYLKLDRDTYAVIPWTTGSDVPVARFMCDVYVEDGKPFEGDPRYVLKKQRQARPVPNVCEEVPGWDHGTGGEAHVLGDHGRMVVAAARQIGDQLRVGEGVGIDGLNLPVRGNGGGLAILVPVAQLLPPQLLREDLFSALKAFGDVGVRSRQHLVVAEAVHIAHLQAVDDHPVEAGEVVGAPLEGGGMRLLEVACQRTREVHGVLLPRSWSWRLKTECGRGV